MTTLDASPPLNRWMKDTLVKDAFQKSIPVLAARVTPTKTGSVLKAEAMKG
jgi:tRNA (guanine37-N1)-methyltransferase